ncbi:hypothetical protein [Xylanimonas sp. McL0601]|uniref:hypothetical protein n=1 Tax=Xylanimonas sp. McL0601 TaxID=3414739 RepID=UPI003CF5E3C2
MRAAILWALENDVATLNLHRHVAHTVIDETRLRRSDAYLVATWRQATGPALAAVGARPT